MNEPNTSKNAETVRRVIEAVENPDDPRRLAAVARRRVRELRRGRSASLVMCVVFSVLMLAILLLSWPWSSGERDQWAGLIVGVWLGIGVCIIQGVGDPVRTLPAASGSGVVVRGALVLLFLLLGGLLYGTVRSLLSPGVLAALDDSQILVVVRVAFLSFLLVISAYNAALIWHHRERILG